MIEKPFPTVILCSEAARPLVKSALDSAFHEVAVLSVSEITNDFNLESFGRIKIESETVTEALKGNRISGRAFWF